MQASKLFLGFTLVVLAAAVVGLWQSFSPRPVQHTASPAVHVPLPTAMPQPAPVEPERSTPPASGVRSVYPGARSPAPPRPGTVEAPAAAPSGSDASPTSAALGPSAGLPEDDGPVDTPAETAPETQTSEGQVDLNTGSLEALNDLGAGMIGKTIIANRPYASPDELISRRVLKRQDYETIRPHVVVR